VLSCQYKGKACASKEIVFKINDLQQFFFSGVAFRPTNEGKPAVFVAKARQAGDWFQRNPTKSTT